MTMHYYMMISTPILSPITTFKKLPISVDDLPLTSSSYLMAASKKKRKITKINLKFTICYFNYKIFF